MGGPPTLLRHSHHHPHYGHPTDHEMLQGVQGCCKISDITRRITSFYQEDALALGEVHRSKLAAILFNIRKKETFFSKLQVNRD